MDAFQALVLGAVQGLTEFIPVSSKGHLALTQQGFDAWHGRDTVGKENLFFAVMMHVGTLLAIFLHYRRPIWRGARGLAGLEPGSELYSRAAILKMALLAVVATLPAAVVGVLFKSRVEAAFANPVATAYGFFATALVLLATERLAERADRQAEPEPGTEPAPNRRRGPAATGLLDALLVGAAQAVALLPGVSRSGMTVAAALLIGLQRPWAVGFSLGISVPAVIGATILELATEDLQLDSAQVGAVVAGALVAAVVGYLAILWLVQLVRSRKLWYCSAYLALMGVLVLGLAWR